MIIIGRLLKCRSEKQLKDAVVQQFVDAEADLGQAESVLVPRAVELGEELAVGEVLEDSVDAGV